MLAAFSPETDLRSLSDPQRAMLGLPLVRGVDTGCRRVQRRRSRNRHHSTPTMPPERGARWVYPTVSMPDDIADRSAKSSPTTMISPLDGEGGFIGNSGRNTADAWDASASEIANAAHFIFIEVRTPFPG